jgi:hypothetical protein
MAIVMYGEARPKRLDGDLTHLESLGKRPLLEIALEQLNGFPVSKHVSLFDGDCGPRYLNRGWYGLAVRMSDHIVNVPAVRTILAHLYSASTLPPAALNIAHAFLLEYVEGVVLRIKIVEGLRKRVFRRERDIGPCFTRELPPSH